MGSKFKRAEDHMFSIELRSKQHIKSLALQDAENGTVLIEGFLGKLQNLSFTEGLMLEINGANGSLRMDLSERELKRLLPRWKSTVKNTKSGVTEE